MVKTAEDFFMLNIKDLHPILKARENRGADLCRLVDAWRTNPHTGRRENETLLFTGGGRNWNGNLPLHWKQLGLDGSPEGDLEVTWIPEPYGGFRYYFICPVSRRKVNRLWLYGQQWLSRHVAPWTLYASQTTHAGFDRRWDQAERTLGKLGVHYLNRHSMTQHYQFPMPPRYMRMTRYAKLCDQLYERYSQRHELVQGMLNLACARIGIQPAEMVENAKTMLT